MRAYKTELQLNNKQRTLCLQHAGAARWAYNWALSQKEEARKNNEKYPTAIDLHKRLNILKKTSVSWMYESSKCAPQEALRNCDRAFDAFFRRCKDSKVSRKGYPKYKSKKRGIGSFSLTGSIIVSNQFIKLPRIGMVRLKEFGYLPKNVAVKSATISERAGHWFVSVLTGNERTRSCGTETIGIDIGVSHLATLSDGTKIDNPRALQSSIKLLQRRSKELSRKQKGSRNRDKARKRLARLHYRISCIRSNAIHQATSAIAKRANVVVLEDLNIKGMQKNRNLSRAISDAGLYEFRRQLEYKMEQAGGKVILADRWYPSSKLCSSCGNKVDVLPLSVRSWTCKACGTKHDRDINAAINLRNIAASLAVEACGVESSGVEKRHTKLFAKKQEPNTKQGKQSQFGLVLENGL
jgi:putative transposase